MTIRYVKKATLITLLGLLPSFAVAESFVAGLNAIDRNHYATAFRSFRPLAESGVAEAQNNLGFLYQNGLGVRRNYSLALSWYTKSAEQNLPEAHHNLGMLNYLGHGVAQDFRIARRHFVKASDGELGAASYMIGLIYFKGEGFQKNDVQARRYFAKAAREGDPNGQYMYAYLLLTGHGKSETESSIWENLFAREAALEDVRASRIWAEIAALNGQQDAKGIAEFARIQSEFEETEIESAISDCMSSNYKNCPFL